MMFEFRAAIVGQFWLYFDFYALHRSEWAIIPENAHKNQNIAKIDLRRTLYRGAKFKHHKFTCAPSFRPLKIKRSWL